MSTLYIVWVGGVADYEGDNLTKARAICQQWLDDGYVDVILEQVQQ